MVGWDHRLNGHEFEQTLGGGGQRSQVCCSPWRCKVGHNLVTEQVLMTYWRRLYVYIRCVFVLKDREANTPYSPS